MYGTMQGTKKKNNMKIRVEINTLIRNELREKINDQMHNLFGWQFIRGLYEELYWKVHAKTRIQINIYNKIFKYDE
jgi:hypothetical protein